MQESEYYNQYAELYDKLEPKEPDKHKILYAYNSARLKTVSLLKVEDLLAMYKYIEEQKDRKAYEKEEARLVYCLNKSLGSELLLELKRRFYIDRGQSKG